MITAGFRNADGIAAGNSLVIPSSASISNIDAGMICAWVMTTSTANTARNICVKNASGTGGIEWVKRAADGTQLRFSKYRATTAQTIDSPTGTLRANVPQFLALTWDINSTATHKMWVGALDTPATMVTPTSVLGTGLPASDLAVNLTIGNAGGAAQGWSGMIWMLAIGTKTDYTTDEIRRLQYRPSPFRGRAGLWIFDSVPAWDRAGNSAPGSLLGSGRLTADVLPRVSA